MLFAASALSKGLTLFTLPVLTGLLAPALYGEAALLAVLCALASVLALAGLDVSYARAHFGTGGLSAAHVEALIWSNGLRNALLASVVAVCAWLLLVNALPGLHANMAIAVALTVLGTVLSALAQTRARLHGHYQRLALGTVLASVLAYALIIPMAYMAALAPYALVVGGVVLAWLPFLSQAQPNWLGLLKRRRQMDSNLARAVLVVGLPALITAPAFWFVSSADRWFLGVLESAEIVGVYAIAVSFGTLGMMMNSAVQAAWVPEVVRAHDKPQTDHFKAEIAQGKRVVIALYAGTWAGITALCPELVVLLTDARYHAAIPIIPWIALGVFFYGCSHLFNTHFLIERRMSVMAKIWLLAVLFNILLNSTLIPKYQMYGAAWAQVVAFAMVAAAMYWRSRHSAMALPITLGFIGQLLGVSALAFFLYQWPQAASVISLLVKLAIATPVLALFVWLNVPKDQHGRRIKWPV